MHLRDYLAGEDTATSATAFARAVGCSHSTVLRWADGSIQPGAEALRKIHQASGGLVTPNDMLGIETESTPPETAEAA